MAGTLHSPFPGMDPYLEHPVIWEPVHRRLIVAIAEQLQPALDPRYVTSTEERVFVEGPQRRIPDAHISRVAGTSLSPAVLKPASSSAVVLEVEDLELHEPRIEILDTYNEMHLVTVIELLSPTNKRAGPGRDSYRAKQKELTAREVHIVEIDLLRSGKRPLAIPEWRLNELKPFEYIASVNTADERNRFTLYPMHLREALPEINVPLEYPDPGVLLNLQSALDHVYHAGRFAWRMKYDEPCVPPLSKDDQAWACERITAWRTAGGGLQK